jgi:hypothetical protein
MSTDTSLHPYWFDEKIQADTSLLQKEMHLFIEAVVKRTKCSYQDAANMYFLSKIAQISQHLPPCN